MTAVLDCLKNIDILILAGGQGTRIRETLGDVPKLLAPIGRKTFFGQKNFTQSIPQKVT